MIHRSGQALLSLINDVLEMSKIESGRTSVTLSEVDLHSLLWELETMFGPRARHKGIAFAVERTENLPQHIVTDERKLRQILINLVGNALKFTDAGGAAVRVSAEPGDGDLTQLVFAVEDSGPGISEEELPRLFQRFEQTRTGRESSSGTGLGLAISQGFARLMDAEIDVESRIGRGSVFTLTLPVRTTDRPLLPPAAAPRRVAGLGPGETRRRVLVVDDVPDNREILRQMLERVGFEIATADDGKQALELFLTWHPDLVLMDLRLPGIGGLETIRSIRTMESGGRVPIIAVTASAFEEDRRLVKEAGGDDFIGKPFREAELFRKIARRLGIRFVFQDGGDAAGETAPLFARTLPGSLRDRLLDAVVQADLDRFLELTAEVAASNPRAARTLRDLAERFEYDRITTLLSDRPPVAAKETS